MLSRAVEVQESDKVIVQPNVDGDRIDNHSNTDMESEDSDDNDNPDSDMESEDSDDDDEPILKLMKKGSAKRNFIAQKKLHKERANNATNKKSEEDRSGKRKAPSVRAKTHIANRVASKRSARGRTLVSPRGKQLPLAPRRQFAPVHSIEASYKDELSKMKEESGKYKCRLIYFVLLIFLMIPFLLQR